MATLSRSTIVRAWTRESIPRYLLVAATLLLLPLPVVDPYSRTIADILVSGIAILFLADTALRADYAWLGTIETRLMLTLWGWIVVCTLIAGTPHAIGEAFAALRLFLFVAALQTWVLNSALARRRLWYVVAGVAVWIVLECWQQQIAGISWPGYHRFGDGALTGPFPRPIAGPAYLAVLFPAFLPLCVMLLQRGGWAWRLLAVATFALAVATMVLIGQRMPAVLALFGLCIAGLLLRRFRIAVLVALLAGLACLLLLPVISPPAYQKLVVHFAQQLETFWQTPYGLLFGRAIVMVQAHPWVGLGWDGFRNNCLAPAYLHGASWLPVTDTADPLGCSIHPHNYWLQIATTAGLPGVALFAALAVVWLRRLGRGAASVDAPVRAGLLVTLCVMLWPIASTMSLFTFPNAGWFFLIAGWGLAEANGALAGDRSCASA